MEQAYLEVDELEVRHSVEDVANGRLGDYLGLAVAPGPSWDA